MAIYFCKITEFINPYIFLIYGILLLYLPFCQFTLKEIIVQLGQIFVQLFTTTPI